MYDWLLKELSGRGIGVFLGLIVGGLITFFLGRWRMYKQKNRIFHGDARDTIVIHHHLVEPASLGECGELPGPGVLRVRTLGQAEMNRVVPNDHLAAVLHHRAMAVTTHNTLISMAGAEGSYLLETLTNFTCDRVANGPFEHDLYVMAPCCEPAELSEHQPITILLISVRDLALFEKWVGCKMVLVEHGSDGSSVLTLMEMAKQFREEQEEIARRRTAGQRTKWVETMYTLDLALDKRTNSIPVKPIPWGRFEHILKKMNLE
jgi:hypothetical protein